MTPDDKIRATIQAVLDGCQVDDCFVVWKSQDSDSDPVIVHGNKRWVEGAIRWYLRETEAQHLTFHMSDIFNDRNEDKEEEG